MFKKILIANRGEIAVRVIRACRELGIRSATVYSDADRSAMHVAMADEAYALGGNTPAESYLRQGLTVEIAQHAKADAIHPGYGFLSENPAFAELVAKSGLKFIGPPSTAIRALGDKTAARKVADRLNIPTVPGTKEPVGSEQEAAEIAESVGYPILLKAAAGGGGKGMRVVRSAAELAGSLRTAMSEAKNAFGDDRVYIEKFIENPRHVEIQILADDFGNAVYLGERECSIQRRHQKVIEESPSAIVDDGLRRNMGAAATRLIQAVGYVNAGTVEFLVDSNKNFYFLEVNTRLQVEHPVTELTTGIDLVRQQIQIAAGQPLALTQETISRRGQAIECRICAEDPEDNFFPSTGKLSRYALPHGPRVRVDNGFRQGDQVSIYYDPLMAKVVAWGENRLEAIETMKRALKEFAITGVKSTIPFCLSVLDNPSFRSGAYDTTYINSQFDPAKLKTVVPRNEHIAAIAAVVLRAESEKTAVRTSNHNENYSTWKKTRSETYR